ncbi:MAG: flagellar assembly peptidoglycan hydrolase FlgJ, partial [Chromatiales bacterium]|nr:flagellar assembly peptidoglycan hydrolase FlgJ [Chromatiales bacterium]
LFDSDQTDQYVDLYDKQLANSLSSQGQGIGLADVIARQLGGGDKNSPQKIEGATANIPARLSTMFRLNDATKVEIPQKDQIQPVEQHRGVGSQPSDVQPKIAHPKVVNKDIFDPVMNTPNDFVKHLWPMAEKAATSLGVNPKAVLAQAALETGWGRSVIRDEDGRNSFNLFNIKKGSGWDGNSIMKNSLEFSDGVASQERSAFRSYDSYQESFNDYAQFLKVNPRYAKALEKGTDAESYIKELQQAGYATDPEYAAKIESIMNRTHFVTTINTLVSNTSDTDSLS